MNKFNKLAVRAAISNVVNNPAICKRYDRTTSLTRESEKKKPAATQLKSGRQLYTSARFQRLRLIKAVYLNYELSLPVTIHPHPRAKNFQFPGDLSLYTRVPACCTHTHTHHRFPRIYTPRYRRSRTHKSDKLPLGDGAYTRLINGE